MSFNTNSKSAGIVGPPGRLLFGHGIEYSKDPLGFVTQCAREYGDIVPLHLGLIPLYLINRPDYIEHVFVTNNKNYTKAERINKHRRPRLLSNGLLGSDGEFWRRQRRLAQPAFHHQRIAAYSKTVVEYANRMAAQWHEGATRNIHLDMLQLSLEIVMKTLFNSQLQNEARELAEPLEFLLNENIRVLSQPIPFPEWLPTPTNLRYNSALAKLDAVVYGIIQQRRHNNKEGDDLLAMLLQAKDEDGNGMNNKQLRDEVITLFLAGWETTALALSYTWHLLAQHPIIQQQLFEELDTVLGERAANIEDLRNLPYLEQVITESMRLYPPAWGVLRQAKAEDKIGGHRIEPGALVAIVQWVTHRDERYFPEPTEFRPGRWADNAAHVIPRYAYFPFGGGQRLCIGNNLALMETRLTLATIARQWRFTTNSISSDSSNKPLEVVPTITLRPKHGIELTLFKR